MTKQRTTILKLPIVSKLHYKCYQFELYFVLFFALIKMFSFQGPYQTLLPGATRPTDYANFATLFAAQQQAAMTAGLYSHCLPPEAHNSWSRTEPTGKLLQTNGPKPQ